MELLGWPQAHWPSGPGRGGQNPARAVQREAAARTPAEPPRCQPGQRVRGDLCTPPPLGFLLRARGNVSHTGNVLGQNT